MPKGKPLRNPNGYGSIVTLSGKRRKKYEVRVNTRMDDRHYPLYDVLGRYEERKEAQIALAKYNEKPYDIGNRNLTFSQVYEKYYTDKYHMGAKKLSRSSMDCTRSAYLHCTSLYDKPYRSIRKDDFQAVMAQERKNGASLSHSLQEHIRNLFRQMDKYAMQNDIIEKSYSAFTEITVEEDDESGVPFTPEELKLLWKNRHLPWVDTVLIYCYSGWRINELAHMPLENIDLMSRTFTGGLKNRFSRNRTIPIHSGIYDMVANRYNPQLKSLIYHDSQKSISEQKYRRYFNQALLDAGIKTPHTPHDCRHTCNTLLEQAGADRIARYRIMGHAGQDINENVYTHKSIDDLRTAIELIKASLE